MSQPQIDAPRAGVVASKWDRTGDVRQSPPHPSVRRHFFLALVMLAALVAVLLMLLRARASGL
jgi:hypothetical protein